MTYTFCMFRKQVEKANRSVEHWSDGFVPQGDHDWDEVNAKCLLLLRQVEQEDIPHRKVGAKKGYRVRQADIERHLEPVEQESLFG